MDQVESSQASSRPRRGRPPIDAHRRAILDATRRELAEVGYERLTFEAVAARADLYRRYINRTWRSKGQLVRDALFDDAARFSTPDTGGFEGDLRELLAQHVDLTVRPEFLRGLPGLQAELRADPELWVETLDRHVRPAVATMATVLERAMARGEIVDHQSAEIVVNTVSGTLQQLATLGLLDRSGLIDHVVRIVADALVVRT